MKISRFLLILCLSVSPIIKSQTLYQTIRGVVQDADAKSSLPGVNVKILELDTLIGAVTDENGKFRLDKVPLGRHSIRFSFIGYEEVVINNVILNSGKEVILTIEMHESVIVGVEVDIIAQTDKTKANNDLVTNSSRNFQSEETERYAGTRSDPSKMVANYAGVSSGNDARNDIMVRGNSPLGVLWRLEGIDIPNPNHFSTQGATGGPISILNNNLLGASDFLTGAFPSEYGNRLAAVFDLRMRHGNNEKFEFISQFGINGFELGAEGPISKKAGSSFLLSYRYSTFAIFNLLGIRFGVSGIPEYNDLAFKLNFPTKKAGQFTLWGIGGKSHIELLDSDRDTADWAFTASGEDLVFGSGMGAAGLTHVYFFNQNTSGKFSVGGTFNTNDILLDTLDVNKTAFRVYTNTSRELSGVLSYYFTHKASARHLFKSGVYFQHQLFDYHSYYWSRKFLVNVDEFKEDGNTGIGQAFVHWQWKPGEKHTFNTGVHYQYFLLNGSQSVEPRFGWRWQFVKNQGLSFAYGMHSQTAPYVYYFLKSYTDSSGSYRETNHDLGLSRSHHFVTGYDLSFSKDFRFKTELYYQELYNIPVEDPELNSFSLINVGNDLEGLPMVDSLVNDGTGRNYGIELTFEKFFSKRYYFLTTLSLYESKYKGSDGIERHTAYSGGYVFNVLGGYEQPVGKKKNSVIAFDVKFNVAAGNRYTPIDIAASVIKDEAVYIDAEAWSRKFKDYSKFDVKVSYRLNKKKATHIFFVNVENVLGRKNILREIYDTNENVLRTEFQLGVFPYGGYRIEF